MRLRATRLGAITSGIAAWLGLRLNGAALRDLAAAIALTSASTITGGRGGSYTLSGLISGAGGLTFAPDAGTTISLTGAAKTYTSLTEVNSGTLVLNATGTVIGNNSGQAPVGATASSGYIVNNGGTLQIAAGSFWQVAQNQPITISGGTLSGAGSGTYFNNVTMNGGTIVSTGDAFRVGFFSAGGNWTLSGTNAIGQVNLVKGGAAAHTFDIVDGTTTVSSIPDLSGFADLAVVKAGAGTLVVSGDSARTGLTTIGAGTLQLGNGGAAGSVGTGNVVNNDTLIVDRSVNTSLNSVISGTGSLIKRGTTVLNLSNNNTHAGGTTISAGTVSLYTNTSCGTGTITLMDADSGANNVSLTAVTNALSIANPIVIANFGTLVPTLGVANVNTNGFTVIYSGPITLVGGKTVRISPATNGFVNLTGVISGAGGVLVNGSSADTSTNRRVIFSATNTFVGTVTSSNGGIIDTRGTLCLGDAGNGVSVGGGCRMSITFGGTRRIGALTGPGEVTVSYAAGAAVLELGNGNASGTFTGTITDGLGTVAIVKVGTGTQTFSGASTYTAGTTINGGTLQAGHVSAFGTGTITVNAGATLDRNGFAIANAIVNNGGTVI